MIKDRKIIIWGTDNYNVLGVLRQLKHFQTNVYLLLVGRKKYCATLSRYCHHCVFVKDVQSGYNYLIKNFDNETLKPIIFPTSDLVAEYIDQYQLILKDKYLFSFTDDKSLCQHLDKMDMYKLALSNGIEAPRSCYLKDDRCAKQVGFPCIVKPIKKINGVSLRFKTKICANRKELDEIVSSLGDIDNYMIQEYINKEFDYLIYGCRTINGDVMMPCVFRKERWVEGDGSYGKIESQLPPFINKEGIISFLKETNYHGLFSFEYGIYKGKAYYYETNFRNDGTSHYFYQAGINLPMYWLKSLCGCSNLDTNTSLDSNNDYFFIDEVYDSENINKNVISRAQWRKDKAKANIYKYYDRKDPIPFIYQFLFQKAYRIYKLLK